VLLDLESGTYFHVNRSARRVCELLLEGGEAASVAARFAGEAGASTEEASRIVAEILRALDATATVREQRGPFSYRFIDSDYVLCLRGVPVLSLHPDGKIVRVHDGAAQLAPLHHSLRVAAPKLISLQGAAVLHASSCVLQQGELTAFCGVSGAGKTTTARAFADAGGALFSEDLLVIDRDAPLSAPLRVYLNGESSAHAWSREAAERPRTAELDCSDLLPRVIGDGRSAALTNLVFIDGLRRGGDEIVLSRPSTGEALVALLASNFLASATHPDWRAHFERSAAIVQAAATHVAWVPRGIEPLRAAARRYIESSTS
jgi:hypothetical protein